MGIPKEILAVERPKSTRIKYRNGHYDVIKRTSVYIKDVETGNVRRLPKEIGKVGEIINFKFVPSTPSKKLSLENVDIKDFGNVKLCYVAGGGLLESLGKSFEINDAKKIFSIALIRSAYGNITDRDIAYRYNTSYASELIPDIALSKNTISTFLDTLGRNVNTINSFMTKKLVELDPNALIIIDGMLKNCNSDTSSFSLFSRKGRLKNSKDISLMFAYDPDTNEPLAMKVYPGNMLDATAFTDFLKTFDIKKGMIIGDKGFKEEWAKQHFDDQTQLNFLFPIEKNREIITTLNLRDYEGVFVFQDEYILYKKVESEGYLYYSFSNQQDFNIDQRSTLAKMHKKGTFDFNKYKKQAEKFGAVVFKSDIDKTAKEIYQIYYERWIIETAFDFYKNICQLDKVRVQGDTRIIGTEFINFVSLIISSRVWRYYQSKNLEHDYSYNQLMMYLTNYKKVRDNKDSKTWTDAISVKYIKELATDLNLV